MELEVGRFVLLYLLMPLIGVILGVAMFIVGKKNLLLNNKKMIYFLLASCVVMALPAFLGYIDYWFMPYAYICLQLFYLILGIYFPIILKSLEKSVAEKSYFVEFLFTFVIMVFGAGAFSLIFNLCNELQYGLWACTCMLSFILPTLFNQAYQTFLDIPLEIYKIWSYDEQTDKWEGSDENDRVIVVELEIAREVGNGAPLNIKAKASESIPFGVWIKMFINHYNVKSSSTPIMYNDGDNSDGWIFYRLSFLGRKKYIDTDMSFSQNKIKEHQVIIAKRTKYNNYNEQIG